MNHFADDSLKLRAAHFLIENLPASYGYTEGNLLKSEKVYKAYDSINVVYSHQTNSEWGREIERSGDAWQRNVYSSCCSFDKFLEYILPYRRLNGLVADGARDTFYNRRIGKYYSIPNKGWMVETGSLLYEYRQLSHSTKR